MPQLEIRDLHVKIKDKEILKGPSPTIKQGEIHAMMGQMIWVSPHWYIHYIDKLPMNSPTGRCY